jgi:hypothetical protein
MDIEVVRNKIKGSNREDSAEDVMRQRQINDRGSCSEASSRRQKMLLAHGSCCDWTRPNARCFSEH